MGMPKGLAKATNYYNRLEALRDWQRVCQDARKIGMSEEEIGQYAPPDGAGWKTIDKHIAKLREAFPQSVEEWDAFLEKHPETAEHYKHKGVLMPQYLQDGS